MKRVAVIGTAAVDSDVLADADEVIVLDPSPDALLAALDEIGDPRFAFLLGSLPILPLPDRWVDAVSGSGGPDPELDRIRR